MRYAFPVAFVLALLLVSCASVTVAPGDTVSVTYTGKFQNGTVFDSNDPAHATDVPARPITSFVPMTATLGQGRLIAGFESALIGMREGEDKTITIRSTDAYGPYKAELQHVIPKTMTHSRTQELRREVQIPVVDLESQLSEPVAPMQVFESGNFRYAITAVEGDNATVRILEARNSTIQLDSVPWTSTIVNTTEDSLILRHELPDKTLVSTVNGPYVAHVNATHIRLETALHLGQELSSNSGPARVSRETADTLTIDLNHPLAGQDLVFDLRVVAIERRE